MIKVLHITARLSEGGAASVARTIADELLSQGVESKFIYGYGPSGLPSPMEGKYSTVRMGNVPIAGLQLLTHHTFGRELTLARIGSLKRAEDAIAEADVVHIHIPHSYFMNLGWLAAMLVKHKKPWIWTLHDQWAFTGRCAQPGSCRSWTEGCGGCRFLAAYPPSFFDFSGRDFEWKRETLSLMMTQPHSWISCARWLAQEFEITGLDRATVITNSVDTAFWGLLNRQEKSPALIESKKKSVIFLLRDLRDKAKVDWNLLKIISEHPLIVLTIVGDNPPEILPQARHLNAINDRSVLLNVLQASEILLFTSTVDYYPLTIAEALVAGLSVVSVASPGAQEFNDIEAMSYFTSHEEAIEAILSSRPNAVSTLDKERFAPKAMAQQYLLKYKTLVGLK